MGRNCIVCSTPLMIGKNWTVAQKEKKNYKCNECRSAYQRDYHKRNREDRLKACKDRYKQNKESILEKQKSKRIEKEYGLSLEEYENLFNKAHCRICGKDEDLVLDHCHYSGHVRGILCRQCNLALGLFKDDINNLMRALVYMEDN